MNARRACTAFPSTSLRTLWRVAGGAALATLVACSSGDGDGGAQDGNGAVMAALSEKPTRQNATRLLVQATFGPTATEIDRLSTMTQGEWLTEQFATPRADTHKAMMERKIQETGGLQGDKYFNLPYSSVQGVFYGSFWKQAATGPDALRQRVAFALSEIFVVSINDTDVLNHPRGYAHYLDLLGDHAFGNYRDLLEAVTLHPMMGLYLSHLGNQKETGTATPDENFAREVMQLFSIGVYELNIDGSNRMGANGQPIETYDNDDITGIAKVFTGFSWYHPTNTDNNTFLGRNKVVDSDWHAMKAFPQFHSTSEKKFLGVTIPAGSTPDPQGDLKIALDAIFNHPNVGPFIGRQLIQKLVTSNPSPAYVTRVAQAFNDNGKGVRGDMKAVLTAVLMDTEARDVTTAQAVSYGKLREPIVRLAHWMRAFNVTARKPADGTNDPDFLQIGNTDGRLNQSALKAPSVFNFFSPGYIAPNSATGRAGLYAPELQMTDTLTVAAYANAMPQWVNNNDNYLSSTYEPEIALARDADALIERLNLLLMAGQMDSAQQSTLRTAINAVSIPPSDDARIRAALLNRVKLAVLMTMVSPQYIVQK